MQRGGSVQKLKDEFSQERSRVSLSRLLRNREGREGVVGRSKLIFELCCSLDQLATHSELFGSFECHGVLDPAILTDVGPHRAKVCRGQESQGVDLPRNWTPILFFRRVAFSGKRTNSRM
jgi:hypothetical protein